MLAMSMPRKPAPMLAMWRVGARGRVGPRALGNAAGGGLATAGSGGDAGPAPIASPGQIPHDDQTYAGVVDNPYQANDAIELRQRAGDPATPPPQAAPTGMTSEVAALLHSDAGYAGKVR
jgi:hypothetical protein